MSNHIALEIITKNSLAFQFRVCISKRVDDVERINVFSSVHASSINAFIEKTRLKSHFIARNRLFTVEISLLTRLTKITLLSLCLLIFVIKKDVIW